MCFCVTGCDVSLTSFRYEQYVEDAYVAFLKQKGQAEQVCKSAIRRFTVTASQRCAIPSHTLRAASFRAS